MDGPRAITQRVLINLGLDHDPVDLRIDPSPRRVMATMSMRSHRPSCRWMACGPYPTVSRPPLGSVTIIVDLRIDPSPRRVMATMSIRSHRASVPMDDPRAITHPVNANVGLGHHHCRSADRPITTEGDGYDVNA